MTKTTAQIRSLYASGAYTGAGVDQRLADFDEWLAAHDQEVLTRDEPVYVGHYLSDRGEGYLIERSGGVHRYVWREPREPDDYGDWVPDPIDAIGSAWEDWSTNGQGYYWSDWSKKLAHDAGYKEES